MIVQIILVSMLICVHKNYTLVQLNANEIK